MGRDILEGNTCILLYDKEDQSFEMSSFPQILLDSGSSEGGADERIPEIQAVAVFRIPRSFLAAYILPPNVCEELCGSVGH